jgi:hypothetical protein
MFKGPKIRDGRNIRLNNNTIHHYYSSFIWYISISSDLSLYLWISQFKNSSAIHYFTHGRGVEQYKDQILVLIVRTFRALVSLCKCFSSCDVNLSLLTSRLCTLIVDFIKYLRGLQIPVVIISYLLQIWYFSSAHWSHVCNDSLAWKYCLPVYFRCICTNAEGN